MAQFIKNARIISTGSYVPAKIYTNEYIETLAQTDSDWVYSNVGIKQRHIAADDESTSDLAAEAAKDALCNAKLDASQIDLIIVATATPDRKAPSTAAIVQHKIKAVNAAAFDISAVCSGFLFAMSIATQYIASNVYKNILVIGADTFSKITDWTRRDCVFFGDGAGAIVMSPTNEGNGFLAYRLYTYTEKDMYGFTVLGGGSERPLTPESMAQGEQYFTMNGRAVYDTATQALPHAINQVLKDTSLSIDDIDLMIPHQPSIRILKYTAEAIGLPFQKVMYNMDKYANTSGATIPLLLDECNKSGKIKVGDIILFAAVGSGWTYGASIIKWDL